MNFQDALITKYILNFRVLSTIQWITFIISGYSIVEKIGEGSFSEVNKIHDKYSRRYYAAKVLKENFERW